MQTWRVLAETVTFVQLNFIATVAMHTISIVSHLVISRLEPIMAP